MVLQVADIAIYVWVAKRYSRLRPPVADGGGADADSSGPGDGDVPGGGGRVVSLITELTIRSSFMKGSEPSHGMLPPAAADKLHHRSFRQHAAGARPDVGTEADDSAHPRSSNSFFLASQQRSAAP